MPRCHNPENISTKKATQVMALQRTPCAVTTLTAQKLSGAVSAYVDVGFQDGYPGKNHIITVIYHNTPQTSPTCPPISPKTQAKSWQAASLARQKVIFPANCHTCSNISFLRLAEGCSFHPVQNRISTTWLVQQLSALNTHGAVWSFWNT